MLQGSVQCLYFPGYSNGIECSLGLLHGMETVLHFSTIRTHLYTNMEMGAAGVGTVQEQPP